MIGCKRLQAKIAGNPGKKEQNHSKKQASSLLAFLSMNTENVASKQQNTWEFCNPVLHKTSQFFS